MSVDTLTPMSSPQGVSLEYWAGSSGVARIGSPALGGLVEALRGQRRTERVGYPARGGEAKRSAVIVVRRRTRCRTQLPTRSRPRRW